MKSDLSAQIDAPTGITITSPGPNEIQVKGPSGEVRRRFFDPKINIHAKGNCATLQAPNSTRKEKARLNSYIAHIQNMLTGVVRPHEYRLKICSGHFPMNVTASGGFLSVKNFLGEKIARTCPIPTEVQVKVEGDKISVTCPDLELAGQTASSIEQLMRITNRDKRVFQDGIYITKKPGEES